MTSLKMTWSLILAGAVVTAACGDSKSSMNPVAPSAVVSGAQSVQADDPGGVASTTGGPKPGNGNGGGNGNGNSGGGNGNGNGNGGGGNGNGGGGNGNGGGGNGNGGGNQPSVPPTQQPPTNTSPSTTRRVEIEGLISAKGSDSITVNAMLVTVPPTAVIRHGSRQFQFSDLHIGDRVHVKAMRTTTGTGSTAVTTIEASEVKLQNPGGDDDDEEEATDLVSVTAFDPQAAETPAGAPVNTGTFRLTRTGSATLLAAPLAVTYTLTGNATNGVDYSSLLLTVTFPANVTTVDVVVQPIADAPTVPAEGPETVILTLTGVAPYDLGAPATATVTIAEQ